MDVQFSLERGKELQVLAPNVKEGGRPAGAGR